MKKLLLILLILFLFLSCYIIYIKTEDDNLFYLSIGDNDFLNTKNELFIDKNYRVIDILNILKYNEEVVYKGKSISIHQLLNKSDILIISIGMNDIYHILNNNTRDIYTYINKVINNIECIFDIVNKYKIKKVFFIGTYNIYSSYEEIFDYMESKVKKICNNNNIMYIDIDGIINDDMLINKESYLLNSNGYDKIYKILIEKYFSI